MKRTKFVLLAIAATALFASCEKTNIEPVADCYECVTEKQQPGAEAFVFVRAKDTCGITPGKAREIEAAGTYTTRLNIQGTNFELKVRTICTPTRRTERPSKGRDW